MFITVTTLPPHRSTVKKPRSYLIKNGPHQQGKADRSGKQILKRRHTLADVDLRRGRLSHGEMGESRKAMREQFQKDIEDTIAEIYHERDTLAR